MISSMAGEKLRDLSQPMDVALLDATVSAFYGTGSKEEVWDIFLLSLLFICSSSLKNCLPVQLFGNLMDFDK